MMCDSKDDLLISQTFCPSPPIVSNEKASANTSTKKFRVWSDILEEEELTRSLSASMNIDTNECQSNGTQFDRNCENYSFWRKSSESDAHRYGRRDSRHKSGRDGRLSRRETHSIDARISCNKSKRTRIGQNRNKSAVKPIHVSDIAEQIARKLNEPKIHLIMSAIGESKASELCSLTLNIESAGGLMVSNGSRRRSAGGVFLHLLKSDHNIEQAIKDHIFLEEQQHFKNRKKMRKRTKQKLKRKQQKNEKKLN